MKEGSSTAHKAHQIIKKMAVQAPLKKWKNSSVEEFERVNPNFLWINCHTVRHLTVDKNKKIELESLDEVTYISSTKFVNLIGTVFNEKALIILPSEKLANRYAKWMNNDYVQVKNEGDNSWQYFIDGHIFVHSASIANVVGRLLQFRICLSVCLPVCPFLNQVLIYRQSLVKKPTSNNISSNNTPHIFTLFTDFRGCGNSALEMDKSGPLLPHTQFPEIKVM